MRFDVLTLFPNMFEAVLGDSIIGRARENGLLELNFIQIRDFSTDKHRRVDDLSVWRRYGDADECAADI